ncbi:hypothetical protein JNJ66_06450 [Candidatus Saccharibacteria bacterium]|nr:hypothetical protein [Candidatus Saccharibacteria bacterium]
MSIREAGWVAVFVALAAVLLSGPQSLQAESLQSPSYTFEESSLGSGGLVQSASPNFQADGAAGVPVVGDAASENFQVSAGNKTTRDPTLSFKLDNPATAFGAFSPQTATTATTTFSVSNYTSYGYVVQIEGTPPKNGPHVIDAMDETDDSRIGEEQFGINLVANTLPESVGANPDQGQFGFGVADGNYNVSNKYRFVSGEPIASAPKSSGETTYTITYLVNVAGLTPGGRYTANQTLIITGTY